VLDSVLFFAFYAYLILLLDSQLNNRAYHSSCPAVPECSSWFLSLTDFRVHEAHIFISIPSHPSTHAFIHLLVQCVWALSVAVEHRQQGRSQYPEGTKGDVTATGSDKKRLLGK
jgi:hypothetical protein